jgi:hypothetical protein
MANFCINNQDVIKLSIVLSFSSTNQFLPFAYEFNDLKIVGGMNANSFIALANLHNICLKLQIAVGLLPLLYNIYFLLLIFNFYLKQTII